MSDPWTRGEISSAGWTRRVRLDQMRAARNQSRAQREITETILSRAVELGAESFALTGSTARRCRTAVSDLDYHVIGMRPDVSDLPGDVDVVASSSAHFRRQLMSGDDFPQWTLRYGCILHDTGAMREGAGLVLGEHLWPSGSRKIERLPDHRRELERLILMGDRDAAQEQARAALTTLARGLLLRAAVFPLARSELPAQLALAGNSEIGRALSHAIHGEAGLDELSAMTLLLDAALTV